MQEAQAKIHFNLVLFNFASQLYFHWSTVFYSSPQWLIGFISILFKVKGIFVIQ